MHFNWTLISDIVEFMEANHHHLPKSYAKFKSTSKKYCSYEEMIELLKWATNVMGEHNFGLQVATQSSLKATQEVDLIMLHSQSLEASINNGIQYSKLISDALECSLQVNHQTYAVRYEENPNWKVQPTPIKKHILDMALVANVKSLMAYTERKYVPACIHFSYKRPRNISAYFRVFNCSLKFNQPFTEIIYDRHILERHQKYVVPGLLESLKEKVVGEISKLTPEHSIIYELKKLILNGKPQRLSLREAADLLHLSQRTLQRKLKQNHTTFKSIECDLTLRLAKTYLIEQQKSVEEISYLLGFSESSAFIRFFKSHAHQTPKEFQKTN